MPLMVGDRVTICVVEDDLNVCESLHAMVSALGHECHTFDSAEALLVHWNLPGCSLLIIDVDLPEMTGIELLLTLRQQGYQTPAVFYTGRSDSRVRAAVAKLQNATLVEKGQDPRWIADVLQKFESPVAS
ncbi:MAG: response regulator [Fuerstiella sp.]